MRAVLVAAVVCTASLAAAEPPGLVIPVPVADTPVPAEPTTASYRWQALAFDAAAIGSLAMGFHRESDDWLNLGTGLYALGGPLVHAGNGRGKRALASLAVRVGLPLAAGYLGNAVAPGTGFCAVADAGPGGSCGGGLPYPGLMIGLALGGLAAMAIDDVAIARPIEKRGRGWAPNATASYNGVLIGAAGAF